MDDIAMHKGLTQLWFAGSKQQHTFTSPQWCQRLLQKEHWDGP